MAEINEIRKRKDRFSALEERIKEKIKDYAGYSFSVDKNRALTVFFDLAQEYNNLEDLYSVAVLIPKVFFGRDSCLYLLDSENWLSKKRCTAESREEVSFEDLTRLTKGPFFRENSYILPIKGNPFLISELPIRSLKEVIGIFEIFEARSLNNDDLLFYEKYANRVGFQIHNKMIGLKNIEHINFIRSLVHDIGHNVIVPNMYFKLLFNQQKNEINKLNDIVASLESEDASQLQNTKGAPEELTSELNEAAHNLKENYQEIIRHFEQTSLFLETLLRRSHFEKGQYVLVKRPCNFKSQIIEPQLRRYKGRLESRGIDIDISQGGVPDEEIQLAVDIGLISQVFANLFSNAVKYARTVYDEQGKAKKFLSYGWERLPGVLSEESCALKLNVFTTGPHIPDKDREKLFEAEYRGENTENEEGTGHGLFFIKEIVELHGGLVGYEPTPMGNNFYIVLPCDLEVDGSKKG